MRAFLQGWGLHTLLSSHGGPFQILWSRLRRPHHMACFVPASVPAQGRCQLISSVTGAELTWQRRAGLLVGADPEPPRRTLRVLPFCSSSSLWWQPEALWPVLPLCSVPLHRPSTCFRGFYHWLLIKGARPGEWVEWWPPDVSIRYLRMWPSLEPWSF